MIDFDATETPTDIAAALSLVQGTLYSAQNVGTVATLFIREAAAQPSITTRAFRIESGGFLTVKPTGLPIWIWTDNHVCPVILAEAP